MRMSAPIFSVQTKKECPQVADTNRVGHHTHMPLSRCSRQITYFALITYYLYNCNPSEMYTTQAVPRKFLGVQSRSRSY
jgi:hypothetical protein